MNKAHEYIINNNDPFVTSLLEKHNPFGLTMNDGRSMFFQQPVEAYLCVMTTAYSMAPKGYIELPLLMTKFYRHLGFTHCVTVAKELVKQKWVTMVFQLPPWGTKETKEFFSRLCSGLCAIAETPFNSHYVDQAWQLLQQRIEMEKEVIIKNEE